MSDKKKKTKEDFHKLLEEIRNAPIVRTLKEGEFDGDDLVRMAKENRDMLRAEGFGELLGLDEYDD